MNDPAPEAERPSRQDLVVAPRQSMLPMVLGAVVCAGTGFGLVWALGIGRSGGLGETARLPAANAPAGEHVGVESQNVAPTGHGPGNLTAQSDATVLEPRPFSPPSNEVETPRPIGDRGWHEHAAPAATPPAADRYPTRPASLETPEAFSPPPAPAAEDFRPSRFAPPGRFPGAGDRPIHLAAGEAAGTDGPDLNQPEVGAPEVNAFEVNAIEVVSPSSAAPIDVETPAGTQVDSPIASADGAASDGDVPLPDRRDAPRVSGGSSGDELSTAEPSQSSDPIDAGQPAPALLPPSIPPSPPPSTAPAASPSKPAGFRPEAAAPAASAIPSPQSVIGTVATNPFAGAPPMGPVGQPGGVLVAPPAGEPRGQRQPGVAGGSGMATSGQGRPGPIQLEGLQTPQLAVEKRGPREIQVGKAARYEIFVRNVGTATAQDVTLRDAVPYGTTLVTTTPPASPAVSGPSAGYGAAQGAAPAAELVWPLGTLAPGGEARVSVEVMPEIEGDVGSVASVSFRTDASVRSRATKPDLRLEASEPKAVRIGGDVKLSLRVTNPGTGVATGVVIDGLLPEGVSHGAGREVEFDVGQLRPGESRTIDLVMGTVGPGVHTARFTARADGRLEVEQPVRIEVTAPTLELTAEMPSRRYLQRPATCLLAMINAGTAPARAVELVAQLPPGMKFVRANHSGWYEERSHRVLWNLEELPAGETGTVEMVLMPVDLGPQKIVAAARSGDGPSDQAAHTVEVEGLAALFFEVTDSEDPIEVGGLTEYIVRIGNQGTKAAGGVRLTATLLGDLEPVDAKGPAAHRVENLAVVFEPLAKLAPSEEAVFRIRARGRREGDQRMQVQLVSDDHPAPITKEEITRVYADR